MDWLDLGIGVWYGVWELFYDRLWLIIVLVIIVMVLLK